MDEKLFFQVLLWDLNLTNIFCSNIKIDSIKSLISESSISINVTKFKLSCSVNYEWGLFGGTVVSDMGNGYTFVTIKLTKKNNLVDHANLTKCDIHLNITDLNFTNKFLNWELVKATIIYMVENEINFLISNTLTNLINNNLTKIFKDVNDKIYPYLIQNNHGNHDNNLTNIVNFTNNKILYSISYLINTIITPKINNIINYLTNKTQNITFSKLSEIYTTSIENTNISVYADNYSVGFNQSLKYSEVLNPISDYKLGNKIKLSNINVMMPLSVYINKSSYYFIFETDFLNMELDLNTEILINKTFLSNLDVAQLINCKCLINSIINKNYFQKKNNFITGNIKVHYNDNDHLFNDVINLVNNAILLFTTEYNKAMSAFYFAYIFNPIILYIEKIIDNQTCIDIHKNTNFWLNYIILTISLISILIFSISYWYKNNLIKNDELKELINNDYFGGSQPLLFDEIIDIKIRWLVLIVIILNISLYLFSNINNGASLLIKLSLGEFYNKTTDSLLTFSLFGSTKDIWESKLYIISIIIFLVSGVWPYIKLITILLCIIFQFGNNRKFLEILDVLNKWSLLDVFLMIIMMCLFNIDIKVGSIYIKIFMNPEIGIHLFLIATIISPILCQIILFYHNKNIRLISYEVNNKSFLEKFSSVKNKTYLTKLGVIILILSYVLTMILMIMSLFLDLFSFKLKGYFAIALDLLNSSIYKKYSVETLLYELPNCVSYDNNLSIRWIQLYSIITIVLFPILSMIILFLILFYPLKNNYQTKLIKTVEYMRTFSVVEVFILAIIIGVLFLSDFVHYIANKMCEQYIITYFSWSPTINDDSFFGVEAKILPGFWVLLIATILHIIITNILLLSFNYSLFNEKFLGSKLLKIFLIRCHILSKIL